MYSSKFITVIYLKVNLFNYLGTNSVSTDTCNTLGGD